MSLLKTIKGLVVCLVMTTTFSAVACAYPYEYGLELVKIEYSPIITGMDFKEAIAKNACFCISDLDCNGWLEFTIAKQDAEGRYRDIQCYEYDSDCADVLRPLEIRPPEAGFSPRVMYMPGENKLTAYRHRDEKQGEERYYHVDTTYRQGGEYTVARQVINKSNNMLFTYLTAMEKGVISESASNPGMLTYTPKLYMDANGKEISKDAFDKAADNYITNTEKVEATFLWIPVAELEKALGLGVDETWEILQKSWQGFRFGNDPQGKNPNELE